jgi:hypothetical protein
MNYYLRLVVFVTLTVLLKLVFVQVDIEKNFKQFQYFANRMRKVATDFSSKMTFNVANKE